LVVFFTKEKGMKSKVMMTALALVALALGCAEERPAINRVQANALKKDFFIGQVVKDAQGNPVLDDASNPIFEYPEFYMRGTVIDVGYGAQQDGLFTSTYAQPVSRIRWEVTENFLNARLAYERIIGTDDKGNPVDGVTKKLKPVPDGQIVASYAIKSHFDIKRAYNTTTGEPLNVVEENTTDRLWFERDYFRVDWSKNFATDAYDFDTLSMMGIYGGIEYEALSYTVDPNHPDAPHFDEADHYFDVTNKVYAKPGVVDLSSLGWGIDSFPACMLPGEFAGGTAPVGNCNPIEVTLRHSFKRVVDNDYEPIDHDGVRFQYIGAFNMNVRYGYDRNYGMVDNQWFRFMARYNIWDRSHYYDDPASMTGEVKCATYETTVAPTSNPMANANRDDKPQDGTADECQAVKDKTGVGGSQCDVFKGKCTLPYVKRAHKTIPWYINGKKDEDLFDASNWAVIEWDLAMRTSVQTARLAECRRAGGADCDKTFPMWHGQQDDIDDALGIAYEVDACRRSKGWSDAACDALVDAMVAKLAAERAAVPNDPANRAGIAAINKMAPVIVLCHNPVIDADSPACGARGLAPRQGDLRYNNVMHIDKPQVPSAWGIMVDADDPVTGEKVAASINIWSHVTDIATQQLVDLVRYMNKELSTEEITNGKYIRDWAAAERLAAGGSGATLSREEINTRLASATKMSSKAFAEMAKNPMPAGLKAETKAARDAIRDIAVRADVPSTSQAEVNARMNAARGTAFEAQLMNPAMVQLAGVPGNIPIAGPIANRVSALGMNNPKFRSQLRHMRDNALAKRGACILDEAPEASALTGIADALKRKFPRLDSETPLQTKQRYDAMFRYLKRRYHYAVIAHEMGHSIGLRHNFVSSAGPLFYRPQYWQLRTRNGVVDQECMDAVDDGSKCVGPRYFDPLTSEEQDQMIWMFMQSTVMDYPGDVSQDTIGLGVTDFAAARLFYSDTVSYYTREDIEAGSKIGTGISETTDTFGGLRGIRYSVGGGVGGPAEFHYSQLQNNYKVIDYCYATTPKQPSWWKKEIDGEWDAVLDGRVVTVDGAVQKCRQMEVDYAFWTDQRMDGGINPFARTGPNVFDLKDGTQRLRVPYHFATDHWADTGNVSVFRHDNGADPYEQAQFFITTQENRHIFDNFRRSRTSFDVRAAADRSFSRYNEKLVGISGGIAFFTTIYQNFSVNAGYTFDTLWPFIVNESVKEQMIAATVAFDHLTRQLARPEDGPHYLRAAKYDDPLMHSAKDPDGNPVGNCGEDNPAACPLVVPNGSTGYMRDIGFGGHPIENALDNSKGDFATEYTLTAGSYYDKIHTIIHMSLSEDRFISQSRNDFYDARMRANGMADIVPDGYRRVIANSLTGDRTLMAPRAAAGSNGKVLLDTTSEDAADPVAKKYPKQPIGWNSWWPKEGPQTCFSDQGRNVCYSFDGETKFGAAIPAKSVPIDPQIGWEVQKFIIAWVLAYIPANEKMQWLDMLRLYKMGDDNDPGFEARVEFEHPVSGQVYVARSFGTECLFGQGESCTGGKIAQRGIAARVLEYANELVAKGYLLDEEGCPATTYYPKGFTKHGRPCLVRQPDGQPIVVGDAALVQIAPDGNNGSAPKTCNQNAAPTCTPLTVYDNRFAWQLEGYKSVVDYLWDALDAYKLRGPHKLGLYP